MDTDIHIQLNHPMHLDIRDGSKLKDVKNHSNEKLKKKRQEKLLKVRKTLQERLSSKLTCFQHRKTECKLVKTPRKHVLKKPDVGRVTEITDQNEDERMSAKEC